MQKIIKIFFHTIPVLLMIALIPFVQNDYVLTVYFLIISVVALWIIKSTKNDIIALAVGFCIMFIFEYIFISTGVEIFISNSLFGIMPLWLPFLWAYGFVAIKRSIEVLDGR
jgi:hypothetical protein